MIVDCGVHDQGRARPLDASVNAIIADLRAKDTTKPPHVNVVVATHHHADHIAGFALDVWKDVAVDEVWVPFVEDTTDDDATKLRQQQTDATNHLLGLLKQRTIGLDPGAWPDALTTAHWFAANSSRNANATDRLLGRNGKGFATTPKIRYLPSKDPAEQTISTGLKDVTVRVLGPSRDPDYLKLMNPPARAGWLALGKDDDPLAHRNQPLFGAAFSMSAAEYRQDFPLLAAANQSLNGLDELDDAGLLAAAAILERSVNNTSVFFVLDVAGLHLVFPGDAQQGAWDHVLDNPESKALIANASFYKIAHHGSGNGTPRSYIESVLADGAYAMLPWGLVKRWQTTIPKQELLDALGLHHHHVIRSDQPIAEPGHVEVHDDLWSQVSFTVK
jgi:beta-lactamase superfamily II metal-dependent hydrolase